MKSVFKIVAVFIFFLLLLTSCKKLGGVAIIEPDTDKSYISAKFNGRAIRFKLAPTAHQKGAAIGYESGYHILMAIGVESFREEFNDILQIGIASRDKIKKGMYIEDFTGASSADQVIINFENRNGEEYESSVYQHSNPLKITISFMDDTRLEGTFSGSIFAEGNFHGEEMKITNGKFLLYYEVYE